MTQKSISTNTSVKWPQWSYDAAKAVNPNPSALSFLPGGPNKAALGFGDRITRGKLRNHQLLPCFGGNMHLNCLVCGPEKVSL